MRFHSHVLLILWFKSMWSISHLLVCNRVRLARRIMGSFGVTSKWVMYAGICDSVLSLILSRWIESMRQSFSMYRPSKKIVHTEVVSLYVELSSSFLLPMPYHTSFFGFTLNAFYRANKASSDPKAWACTSKMCSQRLSAHLMVVVGTILRVRTHTCFNCWW